MHPTDHFVSHSHWDREWYKTFETFRLDLVDMINSLLNLLTTNPDYRYAFTVQSGIYSSRIYIKQANHDCSLNLLPGPLNVR